MSQTLSKALAMIDDLKNTSLVAAAAEQEKAAKDEAANQQRRQWAKRLWAECLAKMEADYPSLSPFLGRAFCEDDWTGVTESSPAVALEVQINIPGHLPIVANYCHKNGHAGPGWQQWPHTRFQALKAADCSPQGGVTLVVVNCKHLDEALLIAEGSFKAINGNWEAALVALHDDYRRAKETIVTRTVCHAEAEYIQQMSSRSAGGSSPIRDHGRPQQGRCVWQTQRAGFAVCRLLFRFLSSLGRKAMLVLEAHFSPDNDNGAFNGDVYGLTAEEIASLVRGDVLVVESVADDGRITKAVIAPGGNKRDLYATMAKAGLIDHDTEIVNSIDLSPRVGGNDAADA